MIVVETMIRYVIIARLYVLSDRSVLCASTETDVRFTKDGYEANGLVSRVNRKRRVRFARILRRLDAQMYESSPN